MSKYYFASMKKIIFCICYLLGHLAVLFFALAVKTFWLKAKATIDTDSDYLLNSALDLIAVFLSIVITRTIFEGWKQKTLEFLGLEFNSKTLPDLLFGFLLSGSLVCFLSIVGIVFRWINIEGFVWETVSIFDIVKRCSIWFLICTLIAAWEELIARGYWLHIIKNSLNSSLGVIISSALFTIAHLMLENATWKVAATIFSLSLLLACSKIRTTQLWLPIGFHVGWNFFLTTVFGFSVSNLNKFSLLRNSISGPEWLVGGKFGLEDGLLTLLAFPLGIIAVHLWTRNREDLCKGDRRLKK